MTETADQGTQADAGGAASVEPPRGRLTGPRNWRAYAKEVGIVVLGVLLALGAERVARAVDEAQKANSTRAIAIRELEAGFGKALVRLSAHDCTLRRIDEIDALLAKPAADFVAPQWIGRPPYGDFVGAGWDAAQQAGQTALLTQDERSRFGEAYSALIRLDAMQEDEQKLWASLRQLEGAAELDAGLRMKMRESLQQARLIAWQAKTRIVQGMAVARKAGVTPKPANNITASLCLPMDMPRAEAVARMNAIWGDDLGEP